MCQLQVHYAYAIHKHWHTECGWGDNQELSYTYLKIQRIISNRSSTAS